MVCDGFEGTEIRPGWMEHACGLDCVERMALRYSQGMAMYVAETGLHANQLEFATSWDTKLIVDASSCDVASAVKEEVGGTPGARVFEQTLGMISPHGAEVLAGLRPGWSALLIFDTIRMRITVRGSNVGTRGRQGGGPFHLGPARSDKQSVYGHKAGRDRRHGSPADECLKISAIAWAASCLRRIQKYRLLTSEELGPP